jgi:hypothetical protein
MSTLTVPGIVDMAIDPNADQLIALTTDGIQIEMVHIPIEPFSIADTYSFDIPSVYDRDRIEIANNGKAYVLTLYGGYLYDLPTHTLESVVGVRDTSETVSGDGSRIVAMKNSLSYITAKYYYDASTNAVVTASVDVFNRPQAFLSRDASRLAFAASGNSFDIYDQDFNLLGGFSTYLFADFGVMSNDGLRFYSYTTGSLDSITAYDISDPQNIVNIGSFTSAKPFFEYLGKGYNSNIRAVLVTPDNRYHLTAGEQYIVLTPIAVDLLP